MKRFTDKSGNMHTLESLQTEVEMRDAQIAKLEKDLITREHMDKHLSDQKYELDRLKLVDSQYKLIDS